MRNTKDFWNLVSNFKAKKIYFDKSITVGEWFDYFKGLLNPDTVTAARIPEFHAEPYASNDLLDAPFVIQELLAVLHKAKDNKAAGPDRIPYEFLKNAPGSFLSSLLLVFNCIYQSDKIPDSFKESIIFPIFKKGAVENVENYRGISFCNTTGKLFTGLLLERLTLWASQLNIVGEFQAGFRQSYSTTDNITNLMNVVRIKLNTKRKKVFTFFVELKAAFDHIDRNSLFHKLAQMGESTKMLKALRNLYSETYNFVWSQDVLQVLWA